MVGHDCGPNGAVATWRDLLSAAVVVRSMLGVSPSAYERPAEFLERRMQPPS
ncbi:replication initiation protein RepC [Ensifer sp. ENS10]|uniref:replication initiation protein RepC n=2 Tax=unclassified Ensifer TaxID=2633371 RepID=UPI0035C78C90